MEQRSIFDELGENEEQEAKEAYKSLLQTGRIRYEIPTYLKFYTVFQYDRLKFRAELNKWLKTPEGINRTVATLEKKQREILENCFIRDKEGNKLRDSDEPYVLSEYRLQRIHELIYEILVSKGIISLFSIQKRLAHMMNEKIPEKPYILKGLMIYPEEKQAEIYGSWELPLKDRILVHLKLLKKLR